MPLYNSSTVAAAIGVPPKWLDNLLSHNKIDGVQSERQGVARRLTFPAVATIALASELNSSWSIPVAVALRTAADLLASRTNPGTNSGEQPPSVSMTLDATAFRAELLERLAQAVEVAPRPIRGRPPGKR